MKLGLGLAWAASASLGNETRTFCSPPQYGHSINTLDRMHWHYLSLVLPIARSARPRGDPSRDFPGNEPTKQMCVRVPVSALLKSLIRRSLTAYTRDYCH